MNEDTTSKLEEILKGTDPNEFSRLSKDELKNVLPSLADYLNEYIAKHNLIVSDIIKRSNLSKDYAYAILNGHRKNPAKDRIVALCLAMHMDLKSAERALKLCETLLYAKNRRDAAFIICFNKKIYDLEDVNDFLIKNGLDPLETCKTS